MPVSLELFLKKAGTRRQRLLRGWINLPSVEVTALRSWIDGTPRPALPTAPKQQPAQTPNPPTPTQNESTTQPTNRITIDKRQPRANTNPCQPMITAFLTRAPQARVPTRPPAPTPSPPPAIPRPMLPAYTRKTNPTALPSAEPRKRAKETNQEARTRRRRRANKEHAESTNHGGSVNLQIMTRTPPRQRAPTQTKGHPRTKLAVGDQIPPKVRTQSADVDVS
jgi:hypothetical protein